MTTPNEELQLAAEAAQRLAHAHGGNILRIRITERNDKTGVTVITYLLGPADEDIAAHLVGFELRFSDGTTFSFNRPDWHETPDLDALVTTTTPTSTLIALRRKPNNHD